MPRWAILGTGFISNTVIEAIGQSDDSAVVAIAGRTPERVAEMATKHGIAIAEVGYDAVLTNPDVDVVYIALPNHAHAEISVAAAAAGKAVLSEKSLTTTMESARELIDGVRAHGAFFVEGLMYLAHPLFVAVAELLTNDRLGTVRSINGYYAANIWGVVNPAGKGTLYNLGCYPASLLHFVMQTAFGEDAFAARSFSAVGNRNDDGNICDAAAAVRFDNGVLATLQSSDSYGSASEFTVVGDKATLRFETNPWLPVAGENVLTLTEFDGGSETIIVSDPHDAFYHQIKMVERCVAEGRTEATRPSPRHNDSLEIMQFLTDWESATLG